MTYNTTLPPALVQRGSFPLTSNQASEDLPFQRWYNFKEAFAPQLVQGIVNSLPVMPRTCLDPFGGSGTTALSCQFLGVRPSLIEVNPFLADLAEAKLTTYDVDALTRDHGRLADFLVYDAKRGLSSEAFPGAPRTFIEPGKEGRWIFDKPIAERIWQYRQFIDYLESQSHARLFRVLLASVLIPFSNVTISGKGRRYRKGWQYKRSEPAALDACFDRAFNRALYDIARYQVRRSTGYSLMRGDARSLISAGEPVDLVLTSPPYPNSFDYTDIYNVELWALGYLQSRGDNRTLRESTLRSHVQIKRDFGPPSADSPALTRTLERLGAATARLWDKDIPAMVAAYFADLESVVIGIRARLSEDGTAVIVVGDSRYGDVHIDVADILCEIAASAGFTTSERQPVRSMRSSPQHGGRFDLNEWLIRLVPA